MEYVERETWIIQRVTGQRVLHLGFLGSTDEDDASRLAGFRRSLHSKLTETAEQVVGVDLAAEVVQSLVRQGEAGLHVGDVEKLDQSSVFSEEPFDTIVIGDLIEHLSNPGSMLDGLHHLLNPGGEMIISTPNALGLPAYIRFVLGRFREGEEHSLNFNILTLENLLRRHGWRVISRLTCHQGFAVRRAGNILFKIGQLWLKRFPRFGGTLLVTAEPFS